MGSFGVHAGQQSLPRRVQMCAWGILSLYEDVDIDYVACVFTPAFFNAELFNKDVYWLGVSSSFESLGRVQGAWFAPGDMANEKNRAGFASILDCDERVSWNSRRIKQGAAGMTLDQGLARFNICTQKDGVRWEAVETGARKLAAFVQSMGRENVWFRWFSRSGVANRETFGYLDVRLSDGFEKSAKNLQNGRTLAAESRTEITCLSMQTAVIWV